MQGINVFASTAARDAAITSPQEGQFAFTKDTNGLWYYDGAAWVASGATGDIEGVTAGVGISGGGTSGTVTITNSMATAIDAKGDLVAGTGADAFSRLAVGANGTILTADSAEATGLKWASAASGGGMTLLSTTTLSGATTTISSISQSYTNLEIIIYGVTNATGQGRLNLACNGVTNLLNQNGTYGNSSAGSSLQATFDGQSISAGNNPALTGGLNVFSVKINGYSSTSYYKPLRSYFYYVDGGGNPYTGNLGGAFISTSAVSSITFSNNGGNMTGGTVLIYGVK
jgi:hypothetical protein